jgi:hypothetical protein
VICPSLETSSLTNSSCLRVKGCAFVARGLPAFFFTAGGADFGAGILILQLLTDSLPQLSPL